VKAARILQAAFILAAALFVHSFVATAQDGELRRSCTALCALAPNYAGEALAAPEISLPDLQGAPRRLSALRGKTVVLLFWSTTCQTCKQQMPAVVELAQSVARDPRFAMLTVAADESPEAVKQTLLQTAGRIDPFPVLVDTENAIVLGKYGTKLFPETWIVDAGGVIRARFDGPRDWTSALVFDLLQSVARGDSCPIEVQAGVASGKGAAVCDKAGQAI
jgi:thiol-disulfide isomerase/thioredoxin